MVFIQNEMKINLSNSFNRYCN